MRDLIISMDLKSYDRDVQNTILLMFLKVWHF